MTHAFSIGFTTILEKEIIVLKKNATILKIEKRLNHGNGGAYILAARLYTSPTNARITDNDAREPIPLYMPYPRGLSMSTHCFVDENHSGDKTTRRLMTGILIFCNRAPIIWHSKRQNGLETSTFGS